MHARRSNKSHRVPNVKLRPAQPKQNAAPHSYPSSLASNPLAQPSAQLPDASFVDSCPRPFQGVVLCATGIPDKTTLFKQALELGAGHHNHFTDRVTHLIANEPGGAKYKCAVQMKIPIVKPSWILECHDVWLKGDDVEFEESLVRHKLPIFSGVVLALSGVEDVDRRLEINRTVCEQDGMFVKAIERPVKVTHLLCSGDDVTDKMKYADKFNQRGESDIKLVWEEWFWDCVNFGGRFDESEYLVSRPRPEPKSSTSKTLLRASSPSFQPSPAPEFAPQAPAPDADAEEELASVKQRVPQDTLQLWENLLGPRGFEIVQGKLTRSPTKSKASAFEQDEDDFVMPVIKPLAVGLEKGSLLSNFKRTNSFAPTTKPMQPFGRIIPADSFLANPPEPSLPIASSSSAKSSGKKPFFAGKRFRAMGEARCLNVKTVVEGGAGFWVVPEEEQVDFIIVRIVSGSKFYRDEDSAVEKAKYRTECWLERCNYEERVCDPEEHVAFRPLGVHTPVRGAEDVNISFSGLEEAEACWIRRFIRAIGANLAQNFSRRSTHLFCPSLIGAKYDKAREWNIPVIDLEWFQEVSRTGVVPSYVIEDEETLPAAIDVDENTMDQEEAAQPFSQNPLLLNESAGEAFVRSSLFLGHSTPKRAKLTTRDLDLGEDFVQMPPQSSSPGGEGELSPILKARQGERIPSSETPSPMKIKNMIPDSPVKSTQLDEQVTKKLQDSITNLLGKRRSSAEEEAAGAGGGASHGRAAKRTRPMSRSKSGSKNTVEDDEAFVYNTNGCVGGRLFAPLPPDDEDTGGSIKEPEGARVMYEDPRQREEKKRLMTLLGTTDPKEQPAKKKNGPRLMKRSSTRLAGF